MADGKEADIVIAIENGIFGDVSDESLANPDTVILDKAVILILLPDGKEIIEISEGVRFPTEYVKETKAREGGFEKWTVGKIMAEKGVVSDHADPHKDLGDKKPRAAILRETLVKALRNNIALLSAKPGSTPHTHP